ncbi:ABC transporter permease [Microbacterium sp. BWT-B31]|uniref:ABC transporter permease n=1 Tax=Microbacterium sp. BWT-B31 TaxID=3232072 RepID=UPI0035290AC5
MSERMPRAAVDASIDELRAEAMEWGRRPRGNGALYVAEHVVRAMRAYGWTIVIGAIGQPVLYLLGLALGLAALISVPITDASGLAVPYVTFVAPALLMTAAIQVGTEEFTYPVMDGFKWRRFFFGFSASPISPGQITTGVLLGASARIVVASAGYYLFIWLFGLVFPPGPLLTPETGWIAIAVGVLGGWAFGAPLMAYAASIEEDKGQFALVQRFVFMPMFLFSGTFYALDTLPVWLQWIGWISPLWHATDLGRTLMYGRPTDPALLAVHLAYLVVLAVVGYVLARRVFARRLAK